MRATGRVSGRGCEYDRKSFGQKLMQLERFDNMDRGGEKRKESTERILHAGISKFNYHSLLWPGGSCAEDPTRATLNITSGSP